MPQIFVWSVVADNAAFLHRLMNEPTVLAVLHELPTSLSCWKKAIPEWDADLDEENYMICLDEQPIGWIGVNGLASETAYIKMLVLLPEYRQQGIGTAALKQTLSQLQRRGCRRAVLYTDVGNLRAQRCYEKCGFAGTERLIQQMSDGSFADRLKMEVSL